MKLIRALRYRTQSYTLFHAKCRARAGDLCHVCTQLTAVDIRSKKNNLFFPICSSKLQNIMPRWDNASKERAIGMLQLGTMQGDVAKCFRAARNTIWRLWNRYRTTNSTADRHRSGRPRLTKTDKTGWLDYVIYAKELKIRPIPQLVFLVYAALVGGLLNVA